MLRHSSLLTCLAALVAACPARADSADPTESPVGTRQIVLEGVVGAHTPSGRFGLALDVGILPWLSLSGGVGLDTYHGSPEFWLALMPHLRLHLPQAPNNALVLGVGASRGKNEAHEGLAFYRLDCELSLEHVFDGGLRVRGFGGLGFASRGSTDGELGIAVGYALWPNPVVPPESSWSIGRWYGWQGLALDGAAATIVYAYRNDYDGRKLSTRAGAAFFVVGGPTVHIAHRKYAKAAVSLGLRTLVPLLLYGLLAGKGGSSGEPGISAGAPLAAGAVIAALIDDLALAWESPVCATGKMGDTTMRSR